MAKPGINAFFSQSLHAPVNNPRWSWGAFDESTNTVFLRLWKDNSIEIDGKPALQVFGKTKPNEVRSGPRVAAQNERQRHIDFAKNGADIYGVICTAIDEKSEIRGIADYDASVLAKLNGFADRNGETWAFIDKWCPVEEVMQRAGAWSDEASDIEAIRRDPKLLATTRAALIEARLGQGGFRERLLKQWGRGCALTGCRFEPLLRASHIKPWRASTNDERLDSRNGLPLVANIDALFDREYITFSDGGLLMVSKKLPADAKNLIGSFDRLRKSLCAEQRDFLSHHREKFSIREHARMSGDATLSA